MRLLTAVVLLALTASAQAPKQAESKPCTQAQNAGGCSVSKTDLKRAADDFRRAIDAQKTGNTQDAFNAAEAASRLVPKNVEYLTMREILRQRLVMAHLEAGNQLLLAHNSDRATTEFRQALALDPENTFAQQRLRDALPPTVGSLSNFTYADSPGELRAAPKAGLHTFHYRGDSRGLFQEIGRNYGIAVEFDESVNSRQLRFDVDDIDFYRAMELACDMTKTFWTPISTKKVMVIADNAQNRAQFERMTMRTFYLSDATSAQELNDVLNVLRTLFDIRQIVHQAETSSIIVRAPRRMLDAATQLLKSLDISRPQVLLDFMVLQVNQSMLKDMGLDLPLQWQAFNLTSAALAALQQPNVQDLINQLISSGGINQANSSSIAALLQQLQNQQNSLFQNPFATFGGGTTRFAVPFAPSTIHFSMNSSRVTTLDSLTLRASNGNDATLKVGERYPIVNATFSPIYNTAAISQVLQNQTYQNPFPSFTFEDLGLSVKAKPQIHQEDVTMDLTLELKALTGQSFNGVPVISSRTYQGALSARDGETVVIAGTMDRSEQYSVTGLPGIARIRGLNAALSHYNPQDTEGELLILITPHIVRKPATSEGLISIPSQ